MMFTILYQLNNTLHFTLSIVHIYLLTPLAIIASHCILSIHIVVDIYWTTNKYNAHMIARDSLTFTHKYVFPCSNYFLCCVPIVIIVEQFLLFIMIMHICILLVLHMDHI